MPPNPRKRKKADVLAPFLNLVDPEARQWDTKEAPLDFTTKEIQLTPVLDHKTQTVVTGVDETHRAEVNRMEALVRLKAFDPAYEYNKELSPTLIEAVKKLAVTATLRANNLPHRIIDDHPLHKKRYATYGSVLESFDTDRLVEFCVEAYAHYDREDIVTHRWLQELAKENLELMHYYEYVDSVVDAYVGSCWSYLNESPIAVLDVMSLHGRNYLADEDVEDIALRLNETIKTFQKPKSGNGKGSGEGDKEEAQSEKFEADAEKAEQESRDALARIISMMADGESHSYLREQFRPIKATTFDQMQEEFEADPNAFYIQWGRMMITTPPLPRSLPPGIKGRANRATDTGGVLKYVQRWTADKQVFSNKLMTHQGGAVLIDDSGSMSFHDDELEAILHMLPGSVVATYSGFSSYIRDGYFNGELKIIARKGKRAMPGDLGSRGGDNIVDGPAVDWLSQQEGPRFWITDMAVTFATNDDAKESLQRYTDTQQAKYHCTKLLRTVRRSNIIIYSNIRTMLQEHAKRKG